MCPHLPNSPRNASSQRKRAHVLTQHPYLAETTIAYYNYCAEQYCGCASNTTLRSRFATEHDSGQQPLQHIHGPCQADNLPQNAYRGTRISFHHTPAPSKTPTVTAFHQIGSRETVEKELDIYPASSLGRAMRFHSDRPQSQ